VIDASSPSRSVRPGVALFGAIAVLVAVVIGGYKITHQSSATTLVTVATAPSTVPTTPPPTTIARTTIPRPSFQQLGAASYSDSVGDHVTLTLTSHHLARSSGVPSNVYSSCSEMNYGDPNSTLYREVTIDVTVRSSLTASVAFNISRMNTPIGSPTNPIRSSDQTVVLMLTNGAECESPYNFTDNGVLWKSLRPDESGTLTVWLSYPDVVSPDFPHGNGVDLRDQSWLLPANLRINGNTTGTPVLSGPSLGACENSRRYFFTPSGAHISGSSC
jgi:hypothetical protein